MGFNPAHNFMKQGFAQNFNFSSRGGYIILFLIGHNNLSALKNKR